MCICTFLCIVFYRGQALDAFSYQTKEALFHYEHFSIKYKTKIQLYYSGYGRSSLALYPKKVLAMWYLYYF